MSDIVLNPLRAGFNLNRINSNFDILEEVVNNGILHLEGGNNIMKQNLDINSNRILNLPEPLTDSEPVPYGYLLQLLGDSGAALTSPLVQPRQVGDSVTTTFATPSTKQVSPSLFFVYLDGVKQRPTTDYSVNSDGTLEFTEAPPVASLIDITLYTPTFKDIDGNEEVTATGTTTSKSLANWFGDLGTAAQADTGTAAGQIPTNANLGTAAIKNVGTAPDEVPTNAILSTSVLAPDGDGSQLTGLPAGYTDADALSLFNASGSAPVYACRAWGNVNGSGTVSIRASGNVSSITDAGVGKYIVNLATAMPSSNYSIVATSSNEVNAGTLGFNSVDIRNSISFELIAITHNGVLYDDTFRFAVFI